MPYVFSGIAVLALLLLTINWLAHTTADNVKKLLGASSALLFLALTILLLFSGRLMAAIPSAIAAFVVYRRYRRAFKLYRTAQSWMGRRPGQDAEGGSNSSEVRTSHLAMVLDHETSSIDGQVLQGEFQGRKISDLSEADLFRLLSTLQSEDEEGSRLLETYLDREADGWRSRYGHGDEPSRAQGGPLTRKEAYRVLGLNEGASEEDIKASHKKLMLKLHPDQGGSDYLASKINEAKDLLLGE